MKEQVKIKNLDKIMDKNEQGSGNSMCYEGIYSINISIISFFYFLENRNYS